MAPRFARAIRLAAIISPAALIASDALAQTAAQAASGSSTAWLLTATSLVLFMTMPGLALFYGGLVHSRNVLSVLMQCTGIGCLGRGLISADPQAGSGEQHGGEEVAGQLVEARGDTPEVLQLAEEALDQIAAAIKLWIHRALHPDVALGRDVRLAAGASHQLDDGAAVVAAVGDQCLGRWHAGQEFGAERLIGGLSGRQHDPDRVAVLVHQRVDLGAQSSTRTANGVIRTPFLPPAAC